MDCRKALGALALGLPTAVAAHFVSFGGAHRIGGNAHDLLIDGGLVGLCLVLAFFSFAAAYAAAATRNGSIVAARLGYFAPGWLMVAIFAATWFAAIEGAEGAHGISVPLVAGALVLAALLVSTALRLGIAMLAALVIAILDLAFREFTFAAVPVSHEPPPSWNACRFVSTHLSRPPPTFA